MKVDDLAKNLAGITPYNIFITYEMGKILFLQPEELYFLLEEETAGLASKEERVKGYRVKTNFSPVREGEKKTKREAVAKVIMGAMKRMKGK